MSAIFSPCRQWRYLLTRTWLTGKGVCLFIMLNPSTADETINDPTVTRCIKYAERWGYQSLQVANLFGWRATDPSELKVVNDPVGSDNDTHIAQAMAGADLIVCAWGDHGSQRNRSKTVRAYSSLVCDVPLHYLKLNKSGEPQHPLYLPGDIQPKEWT